MSAADRLDEIQARADAATDGPWVLMPPLCGPDGQGVYETEDYGPICEVGDPYPRGRNNPQENMEFIAHARADVPRLVAALRAVLDACSTYEKTQAIYRIEMGQREIIRVVRAEIEAALGEVAS